MIELSAVQKRLWKEFLVLAGTVVVAAVAVVWMSGCDSAPKSDQQLREQAAQTTAQAKQDAQQAAANARVAAAEAERKVNDIAAGVKDGLHNGNPGPGAKPAAGVLNINTASADDLSALPGISPARARRIVANRPYDTPHQLVSKGLVSEAEYQQISSQIVAQ
ncbi:ComEA family DNA-binding protein [Silvibacterium sp.]|uniref:ComEA family DNA-binding protein n=1 Tax=Silvibacterium sp. TaxID=1964179 RepID=UPI0039E3EFDF